MTRETVKKVITVCLAIAAFIFILGISSRIEHNYTMGGWVHAVNGNVVTVEDIKGHLWDWVEEEGATYIKGQKVEISFYDNCSDSYRIDDTITGLTLL